MLLLMSRRDGSVRERLPWGLLWNWEADSLKGVVGLLISESFNFKTKSIIDIRIIFINKNGYDWIDEDRTDGGQSGAERRLQEERGHSLLQRHLQGPSAMVRQQTERNQQVINIDSNPTNKA